MLQKKVNYKVYTLLTLIHILISLYFVRIKDYPFVFGCIASYILNHYLIFKIFNLYLEPKASDGVVFKILFYVALKFSILIGSIWIGLAYISENQLVIILNYIFQLIILLFSIIRYSKKN